MEGVDSHWKVRWKDGGGYSVTGWLEGKNGGGSQSVEGLREVMEGVVRHCKS